MKGKGVLDQHVHPQAQGIDAVVAAAHELKAPLVLINHLTDALNDPAISLSPSERQQHLRRLRLTSERMVRLVQQLTLSYRFETDAQLTMAFPTEPVSVNEVASMALHELTPYATEHDQTLRLHEVRCHHVVLANRDVLHDIVVNLVDNAIRHNSAKGVVDVMSHCQQQHVRLSVHDNGAGVGLAELHRLRRSLGVEPQPLSGRAGTSGLGLYIVGQFAQAMGGSFGVGRQGVGATFFVDLIKSWQLSLL